MSKTRARRLPPAPLETGRARQKARTRQLLVTTARKIIASGSRPTVAQVADAAGVSRRTAYRYFPSQKMLMTDAALDGLRPVMEAAISGAAPGADTDDVESRVDAMVGAMQRLAIEHESLLRTIIHETVLHQGSAEVRRGGRRVEWIEMAVKPLRARLGQSRYTRLIAALSLCAGIEAVLVLRDICGLSALQAIAVSQWMARAVVTQSLADRAAARREQTN
jgi:AcrR family transcriptional regulator